MLAITGSSRVIAQIVCIYFCLEHTACAADPEPTHSAISYGPHPHQLIDVYILKGDCPFPVLLWYGRLWEPGISVPPVKRMFQSGVAAVGVRTRVMKDNNWGLTQPEGVGKMDYLVHSPRWGLGFQKIAEERGVVCYVKYPAHPTEKFADIWDFLARQGK